MLEYKRRRWEKDWKTKSWENCVIKSGIKTDYAFLGSSSTYISDFGKEFPDKKIITFGIPGYPVAAFWEMGEMLKAVQPKKIFILGGINGMKEGGADEIIEDYRELLDYLSEMVPSSELIVQAIWPITKSATERYCSIETVRDFNEKLEKLADEKGKRFINIYNELTDETGYLRSDITSDGIHCGPFAYNKWKEALKPYIYE
jgi:lysophospholipase L1-like esterase